MLTMSSKDKQMFQLDLLNMHEADIQAKRLPPGEISVAVIPQTSTSANNDHALRAVAVIPKEFQINASDNELAETRAQVGRSRLIKLLASLNISNNLKELSLQPNYSGCTKRSPHGSNEPLKLGELNDFCLQKIIRLLEFEDIISLAGTCKRLQAAACAVFALIMREHEVIVDCSRSPRYSVVTRSNKFPRMIYGSDVNSFITSFGIVIRKLSIVEMFPVAQRDPDRLELDARIEQLIVRNCWEYLHDITFRRCGPRTMNQTQPFQEVKKVSFINCVIGQEGCNFELLFPEMVKLEIIDCDVTDARKSIVQPFSRLECLDLYVPLSDNSWSSASFTVENVKAAIDLNPQIRSFGLCYWNYVAYDAKLLQYAAQHLTNLKYLRLSHSRFTDFCTGGPIYFESVEKFALSNEYNELGLLDRNLRALTFMGLQKFDMIGRFDTECLDFLARHKTIRNPNNNDLIRFGCILPNIQRIELNGFGLTSTGLIRFITQCSSVSLVKIRHCRFSSTIRKLFTFKCDELGWQVIYINAAHERTIVMKRLEN